MNIVEYDDAQREVLKYYKDGGGKTYYLGWNTLAQHYSIKEGGVTDWSGYAGSGKTELLLECLKNTSEWYGHNHLIYMPDAGTIGEVLGKIIHKMTGKQFDEFYYNADGDKVLNENRVTEAEIIKILPTILHHFKIFDPRKNNRSKAITPKEFWDYAAQNKTKLELFSAVIDSWNYMNHDINGLREDKWLEDTLSYRNELAERENIHLHTIIHPTKAKTDREGKVIMPDMHSLKGGSEWSNNGKSIVIVHREFGSKQTIVKIDKAKPKIVGVQGTCILNLNIKTGQYFEYIGGEDGEGIKHYATKEEKNNHIIEDGMKINTNFDNEAPF